MILGDETGTERAGDVRECCGEGGGSAEAVRLKQKGQWKMISGNWERVSDGPGGKGIHD